MLFIKTVDLFSYMLYHLVMKYVSRTIESSVLQSLPAKEYISIVGPRQAGKTTLLKYVKEYLLDQPEIDENQVIFITFQNPLELVSFEKDPLNYIKSKFKTRKKRNYVLIDEYQYAKNGGRDLKLLYDTQPNLKIIITGSSSLELRQISSQMVGRIFQFYLGQFSFEEMLLAKSSTAGLNNFLRLKQKTNDFLINSTSPQIEEVSPLVKNELKNYFNELCVYGSYPAIVTAATFDLKEQRLLNLYNSYVEKDIVGLLKIGKSEKFLKLVQYLALNIGQIFSNSSLRNELNLTANETDTFLNALEETYIIHKVTPYFTNKNNELKKAPLYYFLDVGLRNWTVANFQDLNLRSDRGHLFENAILTKIMKLVNDNQEFRKINFWRKKSGAEVDFVLERLGNDSTLIPIEVKHQNFTKPKITKSFYSFLDEYHPQIGMVVTKDYFAVEVFKNTKILFMPGYAF